MHPCQVQQVYIIFIATTITIITITTFIKITTSSKKHPNHHKCTTLWSQMMRPFRYCQYFDISNRLRANEELYGTIYWTVWNNELGEIKRSKLISYQTIKPMGQFVPSLIFITTWLIFCQGQVSSCNHQISRSRLLVFLVIGLAITYMLPRWKQ